MNQLEATNKCNKDHINLQNIDTDYNEYNQSND